MGAHMMLMRKGCSGKMNYMRFLEQRKKGFLEQLEKGLATTMRGRRGDRQPQEGNQYKNIILETISILNQSVTIDKYLTKILIKYILGILIKKGMALDKWM